MTSPLTCPICHEPAIGDDHSARKYGDYGANPWAWLAEHLLDCHSRPRGYCYCGLHTGNWRLLGEHYKEMGLENIRNHIIMSQIANL